MKNKLEKILAILILAVMLCFISTEVLARAHTSSHSSSSHSSSHSSSSSSVKSSTPKSSSSSSKSSTSSSSSGSSVKSSTPKTTSSKTGKTYTTSKNSESNRTTINHETVQPKSGTEGKTIINNNPTYYSNYSTGYSYPLTNSIFQFYMLSEIFEGKEEVTEQDVAKALEEKGYTKEEVDQILDEAKQEEEINKPFFDGWKWYNWTLFVICIIIILAIIIVPFFII